MGEPTPKARLTDAIALGVAAALWLACVVVTFLPSFRLTRYPDPALAGGYLCFFIFAPMALGFSVHSRRVRYAQLRVYRDALNPDSARDEYVGVAYLPSNQRAWTPPIWDRGFLRGEGGYLTFRGLGSEFSLPISRVKEVWKLEWRAQGGNASASVGVDWTGPDGALRTVRLTPLDPAEPQPKVAQANDLAERLKAVVARHRQGGESHAVWPTERGWREFSRLRVASEPTNREKLLGEVPFAVLVVLWVLPILGPWLMVAAKLALVSAPVLFAGAMVAPQWLALRRLRAVARQRAADGGESKEKLPV